MEARMYTELFEISDRFCGPPRSGNGGYTCGRIARHLQCPVSVRLKAPPPLNTTLRLESTADKSRLFHGATLIGEARRGQLDIPVPPSPSYRDAEEAAQLFSGFKSHPFPGCFVCGPNRAPNDGLRIFPGSVKGTPVIAAPWTPDSSLVDGVGWVRPEFLWSALDCTGGLSVMQLIDGVAIVLSELCADIKGTVKPKEPCVVIGWPLGVEGRKRFAGSAIYASDGRMVSVARAVWIEVPLSTWG